MWSPCVLLYHRSPRLFLLLLLSVHSFVWSCVYHQNNLQKWWSRARTPSQTIICTRIGRSTSDAGSISLCASVGVHVPVWPNLLKSIRDRPKLCVRWSDARPFDTISRLVWAVDSLWMNWRQPAFTRMKPKVSFNQYLWLFVLWKLPSYSWLIHWFVLIDNIIKSGVKFGKDNRSESNKLFTVTMLIMFLFSFYLFYCSFHSSIHFI